MSILLNKTKTRNYPPTSIRIKCVLDVVSTILIKEKHESKYIDSLISSMHESVREAENAFQVISHNKKERILELYLDRPELVKYSNKFIMNWNNVREHLLPHAYGNLAPKQIREVFPDEVYKKLLAANRYLNR